MQNESYLAPDSLYLQSQNALEVIGIENEKYENLKADFQSNIVNCGEKGDVAESLKIYAEDFCLVLDKAIEANEIDKADHEAIQKAIETVYADKVDIHEVLDGFDILGKIEEAKNKIQEIENRIDEINNMSWIEGLFNSWFGNDSIASLESEKSDWEIILEDFQNKEHRYDGIENDTADLLNESEELRELIWAALETMEESFIDGEYKPNVDAEWRYKFIQMDIQRDYADLYDYLCGLTDDNGNVLYSEKDVLKFIQDLKNNNIDILNSLVEAKASNTSEYAKQLEDIEAILRASCICINTKYSDVRVYIHPNGKELFVPSQQGGGSVFWSGIESERRYGLDSSGCYYFSGAAALSYISGDSVDMAYYLKCLGYNVDITNPKSFSVYPQINSVGQDGHTNLFIDDNFVYNNQLDVILSNSTGKTVTQKVYGNECWSAGWEYPTDINNVCYIVRQQNGGAGPIDTSGRGHWVCIFPIGDNKYQVINHNSNGPDIITHEQLTDLNTAQFELHWE